MLKIRHETNKIMLKLNMIQGKRIFLAILYGIENGCTSMMLFAFYCEQHNSCSCIEQILKRRKFSYLCYGKWFDISDTSTNNNNDRKWKKG